MFSRLSLLALFAMAVILATAVPAGLAREHPEILVTTPEFSSCLPDLPAALGNLPVCPLASSQS